MGWWSGRSPHSPFADPSGVSLLLTATASRPASSPAASPTASTRKRPLIGTPRIRSMGLRARQLPWTIQAVEERAEVSTVERGGQVDEVLEQRRLGQVAEVDRGRIRRRESAAR